MVSISNDRLLLLWLKRVPKIVSRRVIEIPNPNHVNQLKRGATNWNQWRKKHSDVIPNFNGADCRGCQLHGSQLSQSDFHGNDLLHANLLKCS